MVEPGAALAPPCLTNCVAAPTASVTASVSSPPDRNTWAAAAAKQSPAPQESCGPRMASAGARNGTASPVESRAPLSPRVMATALPQAWLSAAASRAALASAEPGPTVPFRSPFRSEANLRASSWLGVTSLLPGSGRAPAGCGSHPTGVAAGGQARSARAVPFALAVDDRYRGVGSDPAHGPVQVDVEKGVAHDDQRAAPHRAVSSTVPMPSRTAASTAAHMMWIAARCTSCTVDVTGVSTVIASAQASATGLGP